MKKILIASFLLLISLFLHPRQSFAALKVGQKAPAFSLQNQAGQTVSLESRKGSWTVLYFYPKASTPGCTKQACAFRDSIKVIREQGAQVYGVSGDEVKDLEKFHQEHKLTFELLADPDASTISAYDVKIPGLNMSKRVTYIISPDLTVAHVEDDVDPMLDAQKVAKKLQELKAAP